MGGVAEEWEDDLLWLRPLAEPIHGEESHTCFTGLFCTILRQTLIV